MQANLARWRQSFNKFRLTKSLLSCPHFSLSSWTDPSPAGFGVWEPNIQVILSSFSTEEEARKPTKSALCAHKEVGSRACSFHLRILSLSPPTIPPCLLPAQPHVPPIYLEFIPDTGHLYVPWSYHAWVTVSKPFSRFSLRQGHIFPLFVVPFSAIIYPFHVSWSCFLDLHWPGIKWKQIIHFLKDSSHVFRFKLIFGAYDVAAPIPSIVLGTF